MRTCRGVRLVIRQQTAGSTPIGETARTSKLTDHPPVLYEAVWHWFVTTPRTARPASSGCACTCSATPSAIAPAMSAEAVIPCMACSPAPWSTRSIQVVFAPLRCASSRVASPFQRAGAARRFLARPHSSSSVFPRPPTVSSTKALERPREWRSHNRSQATVQLRRCRQRKQRTVARFD
jgi:hypothetical protein